MSRSPAAVSSGRTNRRFILLAITLGLIGAVLVYVATNRDSSTGGNNGGESTANIPVIVAKADIPARTKITAGMVEVRNVNADAKSALAFSNVDEVVDQVTRFPVAANEQVLSSKIVSLAPGESASDRSLSFVIPAGKRAIAITTSPLIGAGGLVLPGDYIDVLFTPTPEFAQKAGKSQFYTQTILQNVEVLAVSQTVVDTVPDGDTNSNGQVVRNTESKVQAEAVTVTIVLAQGDAERVFLAEQNGTLRFTVRHFGDGETPAIPSITERDVIP